MCCCFLPQSEGGRQRQCLRQGVDGHHQAEQHHRALPERGHQVPGPRLHPARRELWAQRWAVKCFALIWLLSAEPWQFWVWSQNKGLYSCILFYFIENLTGPWTQIQILFLSTLSWFAFCCLSFTLLCTYTLCTQKNYYTEVFCWVLIAPNCPLLVCNKLTQTEPSGNENKGKSQANYKL